METKLCLLETKRNKIIETLKSRSLKNTQNEIKANLILENMNLKQGNLNQIHQNLELKGDIILQLDSLNKKSTLANNAKSCFEGIIKFSFTLDSILSNYKISDFNDLLDLKQYILKLDAQDNLLKYLDSKSLLAYSTIKSKLQVDLSNALKSTNYPKAESNTIYPALESAITNLLKLTDTNKNTVVDPIFDTIVKTHIDYLSLHFSGSKPTNRLDKPEWLFQTIIKIIDTSSDFLYMHIQPIFKSLEIKQDSRHGFVIQLINFIEIKFKADLNLLSLPENHQVLSHVIKETISFDSKILENFWYNSKLADVFLDDSDIIKAWVSIEFDNTFDTFTAIIKESYSTLSLQKTPKKALEFKLLIQDVSLRYLGIQNNKLKMIFFDQIQLVLINEFLILVKSDVEKSPYNSIELYSSILSNLEFILDCLIEWNNDAIFLGLIESALVGPFDTSITEYTRSIEKLLDITVSEIIETISKLAIKYKRQVWNITSVDSLSHELMTSWQYLKDSEILLSKYLNGTRLMQINYSLAMQLDLLFFDICKYNLFSIQGANQLKTDSNQMAILLNAPNLKKINETCLLLSMDLDSENGSVLELLVGLKNADDKRLFLDQIGIVCLSPAEVVEIIDKRIDMK